MSRYDTRKDSLQIITEIQVAKGEGQWKHVYSTLLPSLKDKRKSASQIAYYLLSVGESAFELYAESKHTFNFLTEAKKHLHDLKDQDKHGYELEAQILGYRINFIECKHQTNKAKQALAELETFDLVSAAKKKQCAGHHILIPFMMEKGKCLEKLNYKRRLVLEAYAECAQMFKDIQHTPIARQGRIRKVYNESLYQSALINLNIGEIMTAVDTLRFLASKTNEAMVLPHFRNQALQRLPGFLLFHVCDEMYRKPTVSALTTPLSGENSHSFIPSSRLEETYLLYQLYRVEILDKKKKKTPDRNTVDFARKLFNGLAVCLTMMNNFHEYYNIYSEAMEFSYQQPDVWKQYALALMVDKQYRRSSKIFKQCLTMPALQSSIICHLMLVKLYLNYLEKPQKALKYSEIALSIADDRGEFWLFPRIFHCVGLSHAKLAINAMESELRSYHEQLALESLLKAVELCPSNDDFQFSLALLFANMREIELAEASLGKIENIEKNHQFCLLDALLLSTHQLYDQAIKRLKFVFDSDSKELQLVNSDYIAIYFTLAHLYFEENKFKNGLNVLSFILKDCRKKMDRLKSEAPPRKKSGASKPVTPNILKHIHDKEEGIPVAVCSLELLKLQKLEAQIIIEQTAFLLELDKVNEAYLCLQDAYNSSVAPDVFYQFGQFYELTDDIKKAVIQYNKAIAIGNRCSKSHVGLARCHFKLVQLELTQTHLTKALNIDPCDHEAWTLLGDLCVAMGGREDEAIQAYTHAADMRDRCPVLPFTTIPYTLL